MSRSHRLRTSFAAAAAILAVSAATPSLAMHATGAADPWSLQTEADGRFFSIGVSAGQIAGTCVERVFDYPLGRKFLLGELKWDFKDITIAGLMASAGLGGRYRVNIGYWSAFSGGSGLMVDHDWIYAPALTKDMIQDDGNWTHESRHPDTSLDGGTMFDLNISILALRTGPLSLRGILGCKSDAWKWTARGGTYIYSDQGFRDNVGSLNPGEQAIEYKQQYTIPYLGLGGNWSTESFLMDIHLLMSPAVWASSTDYHNLRNIRNPGSQSSGKILPSS